LTNLEILRSFKVQTNVKNFPKVVLSKWLANTMYSEKFFPKSFLIKLLKDIRLCKYTEKSMNKDILAWEKKKGLSKFSKNQVQ